MKLKRSRAILPKLPQIGAKVYRGSVILNRAESRDSHPACNVIQAGTLIPDERLLIGS